jgi:hypothetical protein
MALARAQQDLWTEHARLWMTITQRMFGLGGESAEKRRSDRRFRDPAWSEVAVFDYIKQSYLITARDRLIGGRYIRAQGTSVSPHVASMSDGVSGKMRIPCKSVESIELTEGASATRKRAAGAAL